MHLTMEAIILQCMMPDTSAVEQGMAKLREAFKNPQSTLELAQLAIAAGSAQVRQYAAVLLRKKYSKSKGWSKLDNSLRTQVKALLIQSLMNENDKSVKKSVAHLAGVLVKHEAARNGWPEIFDLMMRLLQSAEVSHQEFGLFILEKLTEMASIKTFAGQFENILKILTNVADSIQECSDPRAPYILNIMMNLTNYLAEHPVVTNYYIALIPVTMKLIIHFSADSEDKAIEGFELLDELTEEYPKVMNPHFNDFVKMCIHVVSDPKSLETVKSRAITSLGWLVKLRKKTILKNCLLDSIFECLFAVLSSPVDDFGGEYDDDESITPGQSAHAALDDIALNIPASTLLTVMLKYVQPALQSDNEFVLKACFISLATVTEGCSDYIRSKHLEDFLKLAITGINNNSNIVKSAAFYAIGQFSEYLQPEISKYVNEVLPILFQNLDIVLQRLQKEPQGSTAVARRVFYALEIFIENLGDDLLPYLPVLMKALSEIILETNSAPEIWACALSTVGSICTACEKNVLPYFAQIVEMLKKFLVKPDLTNEDQINVVCEAIDALGIFARTIGSENFAPLVEDSMQYALNVLAEGEDPDLRKSVYGLLGAMSCVLKDDMHVVIAKVLDRMMDSITSTESIITQFKDNGDDAHLIYEDLNDSEEEEKAEDEEDIANTDDETENDEEDEDVAGYTVENAFVAEKEAAISAVREIAMNAEKAFQPYTDSFFNAIFELLTFPQEDIKVSAIEALTQLCMIYAKENTEEKAFPLFQSLARLVPKLAEIVRCDTERDVVIATLQSYTTLLDKLGALMLHVEGHKEAFVNCALDVMRGQTECQDTTGQDPDEEEDPEEAEHDEYLFDHACQLLVAVGKHMPIEEFATQMKVAMPILVKRNGPEATEIRRANSLGTIAESIGILGAHVVPYVNTLAPLAIGLSRDSTKDVRNNAIFALGELALHAGPSMYEHYPMLLKLMSEVMAEEKEGLVRDNIIGAVARMMLAHVEGVQPIEDVFGVLVNQLPLATDFEENLAVFRAILHLYQMGNPVIRANLAKLLAVSIQVLQSPDMSDDTKNLALKFTRQARKDFDAEWKAFIGSVQLDMGLMSMINADES
ncbi:importin-4-like [Trichogramma pretiosum]|uniref:importin-4-like n=1 Tax=Trichogramma pretiosum TaxID=7493 RepID=UPI0006C9C152|nr:importin-4-like [Trichogramma pretiosum]